MNIFCLNLKPYLQSIKAAGSGEQGTVQPYRSLVQFGRGPLSLQSINSHGSLRPFCRVTSIIKILSHLESFRGVDYLFIYWKGVKVCILTLIPKVSNYPSQSVDLCVFVLCFNVFRKGYGWMCNVTPIGATDMAWDCLCFISFF